MTSTDPVYRPVIGDEEGIRIGQLVNLNKDKFIPGITLWDQQSIDESVRLESVKKDRFSVRAHKSLKDTSDLLDMSAEMKASFCGGMITVKGKAAILNKRKRSSNHARVDYVHHRQTFKKHLTHTATTAYGEAGCYNTRAVNQAALSPELGATHVVVEVVYGGGYSMSFELEEKEHIKHDHLHGELEVCVKAIGAGGKAKIVIDEEEKDISEELGVSCDIDANIAGDGRLPTNWEEAKDLVAGFPAMFETSFGKRGSEHGDNDNTGLGVPVKIGLLPLVCLPCKDAAAALMRNISAEIVDRAVRLHDSFATRATAANALLIHAGQDDYLRGAFPRVERDLKTFVELSDRYKQEVIEKRMQALLPSVAPGNSSEKKLTDLMIEAARGPFGPESYRTWLEHKEAEMAQLRGILRAYVPENCVIVKTGGDLSAVTAHDVECAVIAMFKATQEHGLDAMRATLDGRSVAGGGTAMPWFAQPGAMGNLQQTFALFHEFAVANAGLGRPITFAFVDTVSHEHFMRRTLGIDVEKSGIMLSMHMAVEKEFVPPSAPRALRVAIGGGPLGLHIEWDEPERMPSSVCSATVPAACTPMPITKWEIEYTWEGNVENPKMKSVEQDRFVHFKHLPRVKHTFKVRAVCKAGVSAWSQELKATPGLATNNWNSLGKLHSFVLEDMVALYPFTHFEWGASFNNENVLPCTVNGWNGTTTIFSITTPYLQGDHKDKLTHGSCMFTRGTRDGPTQAKKKTNGTAEFLHHYTDEAGRKDHRSVDNSPRVYVRPLTHPWQSCGNLKTRDDFRRLREEYPFTSWEWGTNYNGRAIRVLTITSWNRGWRIHTRERYPMGDSAESIRFGCSVWTHGTDDAESQGNHFFHHYQHIKSDGSVGSMGSNGTCGFQLFVKRIA